jgi:hypothetical protein
MIHLHIAGDRGLDWAQGVVTDYHDLHAPVDPRCSPVAYLIELDHGSSSAVGCLIFGRPEATCCYDGKLTYGSLKDVESGRAQYDRWEVLNLARVWLSPVVQYGGRFCSSRFLPGFVDRRGIWRSTLASAAIELALTSIGSDYLMQRPPCFVEEPYDIRVVLSYCDTNLHTGTIYRAAGFERARTNERGIETYYTTAVAPLTSYQRDMIEKRAGQSWRSKRHRAARAAKHTQEAMQL